MTNTFQIEADKWEELIKFQTTFETRKYVAMSSAKSVSDTAYSSRSDSSTDIEGEFENL